MKARVGTLDIVATHLAHRKQNTPTRLVQIDELLRQRPDIVVGDLNFWPTWDEQRVFAAAGFVSAQDVTGLAAAFTSPTHRPTNRVDWIWGNEKVKFLAFQVLSDAKNSDHFPILAVVSTSG